MLSSRPALGPCRRIFSTTISLIHLATLTTELSVWRTALIVCFQLTQIMRSVGSFARNDGKSWLLVGKCYAPRMTRHPSSTLSLGPAFNTRSTTPPVSLSLLCPLCSFSTSSIISLGQHLRSQHKDDYLLESQLAGFGLVRCPSCAKPFHTLKGHIEHCPSTFCIATSVTEDDAKSDPPSLPTVSDPLLLVGSFVPRLWRSLPIFLWKSWTDLCRPFFRNYISASVSFTDNPQLLGDALRSILSLPRRHLLRVRTRSSTSAYEILKRRLFDVSAGIDLTQGVRKSDTRSPEQRKFERIETLVREGHTGKAAAELTRVESRALSQDTVDKLKKLHPLGPDVLPLLPPGFPHSSTSRCGHLTQHHPEDGQWCCAGSFWLDGRPSSPFSGR